MRWANSRKETPETDSGNSQAEHIYEERTTSVIKKSHKEKSRTTGFTHEILSNQNLHRYLQAMDGTLSNILCGLYFLNTKNTDITAKGSHRSIFLINISIKTLYKIIWYHIKILHHDQVGFICYECKVSSKLVQRWLC